MAKTFVQSNTLLARDDAGEFGLSASHWKSLSEKERNIYRQVRPLRRCAYKVDVPWYLLENHLTSLPTAGGRLTLCPDFQRGHVWSREKQVAFVENVFRGTAPTVLRFNSPNWGGHSASGDLDPDEIVCVDGLQRLTAVRQFIAGDLAVFGGLRVEDLQGTSFDPRRLMLSIEMFDIVNRKDLLTFYLDINSGGVVHSEEELARVRALRDQDSPAQQAPVRQAPRRR